MEQPAEGTFTALWRYQLTEDEIYDGLRRSGVRRAGPTRDWLQTAVLGLVAVFCIIAFLMIIFIIVRKLIFGDPVSGWPSLVCIILMTSGVQFFCTGILGQYLAKAYMEVKRRPIYLVKEEI